MIFCEYDSDKQLSKEEIRDIVEKAGQWKGISLDYPGGIYYHYCIVKDGEKNIYRSEVADNLLKLEASYAKDFDMAFNQLEYLQNHIRSYFK